VGDEEAEPQSSDSLLYHPDFGDEEEEPDVAKADDLHVLDPDDDDHNRKARYSKSRPHIVVQNTLPAIVTKKGHRHTDAEVHGKPKTPHRDEDGHHIKPKKADKQKDDHQTKPKKEDKQEDHHHTKQKNEDNHAKHKREDKRHPDVVTFAEDDHGHELRAKTSRSSRHTDAEALVTEPHHSNIRHHKSADLRKAKKDKHGDTEKGDKHHHDSGHKPRHGDDDRPKRDGNKHHDSEKVVDHNDPGDEKDKPVDNQET
jgi:hypothetical protein